MLARCGVDTPLLIGQAGELERSIGIREALVDLRVEGMNKVTDDRLCFHMEGLKRRSLVVDDPSLQRPTWGQAEHYAANARDNFGCNRNESWSVFVEILVA